METGSDPPDVARPTTWNPFLSNVRVNFPSLDEALHDPPSSSASAHHAMLSIEELSRQSPTDFGVAQAGQAAYQDSRHPTYGVDEASVEAAEELEAGRWFQEQDRLKAERVSNTAGNLARTCSAARQTKIDGRIILDIGFSLCRVNFERQAGCSQMINVTLFLGCSPHEFHEIIPNFLQGGNCNVRDDAHMMNN